MTEEYTRRTSPGCLVRALWFLFIGLVVGPFWTAAAWALIVTIIGMPFGLWMINRLPQVMTLREVQRVGRVERVDGRIVMRESTVPQPPFLLRAVYFILVGWWFSLLWLILAWALTGLTLGLGLPLAFWMFDRVPAVTTLARY